MIVIPAVARAQSPEMKNRTWKSLNKRTRLARGGDNGES